MQLASWKTRIPAVAGVGRPYRLSVSHDIGSQKESDFSARLQSHTHYGDAANRTLG